MDRGWRRQSVFARLRAASALTVFLGFCTCVLSACAGHRWVDENCNRDGGLTVHRHVAADGIWFDSGYPNALCSVCGELLVVGVVRYIDFQSIGNLSSTVGKAPGYYRLSLGHRGEPACLEYRGISGLAPDACLAVQPLPGKPDKGLVFRETSDGGKVEADGVTPIANYRNTYELVDVPSGETVAAFHRYAHAYYWTRKLGGTMSFYECAEKLPTIGEFLKAALGR